ncbi:MAG: B12-binding domain-containing radical SAM protein [Actinobacteria bacterium]|nr:B12-binding domain-containing radical SAM protein [Actinomycetota bacterium]
MKILFIQPYDRAGSVRLFGRVYMSQLTLPLLAALVPPEHEVRIVDENVDPIDYEWPDVAGITIMTVMAPRAYRIADEFRKRGKRVILGGVHPSLLPEEALEHADAVVVGEAEGVIEEVLKDLTAGRSEGIYQNEEKPDLVGSPVPRHDLVDINKYIDIPKVETSRGCPFNCNFCSTTPMFGNRMRYRPVEEVVEEIKKIKAEFVFFTDNNIVGNPKYAKELFRALIPLKISWISQGSLNLAHDLELLRLAARSGCIGMLIGFESLGSEAIESLGKKVNKVSQYARDVKRLHRHGIGIIGCFVFGFDEDDEMIFERTVDFVRRVNIEVPQFTILTPYPGTVLRRSLEEAGRIIHSRWDEYDIGHAVFKPAKMSAAELEAKYRAACRETYSWWKMIRRILRGALYLHSPYKITVFWEINVVYRRLFELTTETAQADEVAAQPGFVSTLEREPTP